jgi:hypothetical protein
VRDLETSEPGRATGSTRDEDAGSMTRGHREEGGREGFDDRGEPEMSQQGRMGDGTVKGTARDCVRACAKGFATAGISVLPAQRRAPERPRRG